MKNKLRLAGFWVNALVALLAVTVFLPALRAKLPPTTQASPSTQLPISTLPSTQVSGSTLRPPPRMENRILLVFDTAADMKKRLPDEKKGILKLFAITLGAELQDGDTIGVWTFDEDLRMGELPLQRWRAEDINIISSNIIKLVEKHRYSKTTSFDKLIPMLNRVMAGSPRLTTLVFCDGEAPVKGTPVDDAINAIFKKNEGLMRKDREPYVLVFRTQSGNYVGSTINTAISINVPQFPLPPAPPPPPPLPVVQPTPAVESTVPPLIVIGRVVETNLPPPAQAPAPVQEQTPPSPPMATTKATPASAASLVVIMTPAHSATNAVVPETNPIPVAVTAPPPEVMGPPPVTNFTATTTATATPAGRGVMIAIAGGILIIVCVGGYMISRRSRRRNSSSLITESLKKK
jgi:hypothetical protein